LRLEEPAREQESVEQHGGHEHGAVSRKYAYDGWNMVAEMDALTGNW
jgi:hypothetical protein